MGYDHFIEDTVFPLLEAQEEFTFNEMWEHYCGFPIKTKEDWTAARKFFTESAQNRKMRMSTLKYNMLDFTKDDELYMRILRFDWNSPENRGHSKQIRGIRWFDEFIYEKLKQ